MTSQTLNDLRYQYYATALGISLTAAMNQSLDDLEYQALISGALTSGGGGGSTIILKDEGTTVAPAATTLNFVGPQIAANAAGTVTQTPQQASQVPNNTFPPILTATDVQTSLQQLATKLAPLLMPTTVKTAGYTAAAWDFVPVDTTSGSVTILLPAVQPKGTCIKVKHLTQGATNNTVTVQAQGVDVLLRPTSGITTYVLAQQGQDVMFVYDNGPQVWWELDSTKTLNIITTPKSSNYSMAPNEFVLCDVSTAGFNVTLPAAPQNGTQCGARIVTFLAGNSVNFFASGTDVFNKTGGPTSQLGALQYNNMGIVYEYQSGIWTLVASGLPLSSLDQRYVQSATNLTATNGTDIQLDTPVGLTQPISVLTASHNLWTPTWFRATVDDPAPVNNSAVLQNAPGLAVALLANSAYTFDVAAIMDSNPTAKLRFNFTFPAGAVGEWVAYGMNSGYIGNGAAAPCVNPNYYVALGGADQQFGCMNAGTPSFNNIHGQIVTGGTAGTLQFKYAQWAATAVNTVMKAGSSICVRKVA